MMSKIKHRLDVTYVLIALLPIPLIQLEVSRARTSVWCAARSPWTSPADMHAAACLLYSCIRLQLSVASAAQITPMRLLMGNIGRPADEVVAFSHSQWDASRLARFHPGGVPDIHVNDSGLLYCPLFLDNFYSR